MEKMNDDRIRKIESIMNDFIVDTNAEQSVIFDNMYLFYKLSEILFDNLPAYHNNEGVTIDVSKISKSDIFNNIGIVKKFYNKYHINFNIDELVSNGTIDYEFVEQPGIRTIGYGRNYYENNHKLINLYNNGLITDSVILLHELSHLRNHPNCFRNQVSDLLTEALAYTEELIFLDYLEEVGYINEKKAFINVDYNSCKHLSQESKSLFKMFELYKNIGGISKDDYKLYYEDDLDYDLDIKILNKLIINSNINIYKKAEYIMGYSLSTYMYFEFKKKSDFMEKIQKLHSKINQCNMLDNLKEMELSNLGVDDFTKITVAINQMKDELEKDRKKLTK